MPWNHRKIYGKKEEKGTIAKTKTAWHHPTLLIYNKKIREDMQ